MGPASVLSESECKGNIVFHIMQYIHKKTYKKDDNIHYIINLPQHKTSF